jgi:hypothetical protein
MFSFLIKLITKKSPPAAIVNNIPNINSPMFPINIAKIEGINSNIIQIIPNLIDLNPCFANLDQVTS